MINVLLDPYIFAFRPDSEAPPLDDYIDVLTGFYDLAEVRAFHLVISPYTPSVLEQTQSYPYWNTLTKIPHLQRRDVVALIEGIMKKATSTLTTFGCDFFLIEDPTCNPDLHLRERADLFIEQYYQLTAFCDLDLFVNEGAHGPIIVTRGTTPGGGYVRVQGTILECDCPQPLPYVPPRTYAREILHISSLRELIERVDPSGILTTDPIAAIECAINQHPKSEFGWGRRLYKWSMHVEFLASAKKHGFLDDPDKGKQLLKACAELAVGENLRLSHALRTGREATKPQRKRVSDGAEAFRRDIDYEYHLHYWQTADGPELARVVVHEDFSIPE